MLCLTLFVVRACLYTCVCVHMYIDSVPHALRGRRVHACIITLVFSVEWHCGRMLWPWKKKIGARLSSRACVQARVYIYSVLHTYIVGAVLVTACVCMYTCILYINYCYHGQEYIFAMTMKKKGRGKARQSYGVLPALNMDVHCTTRRMHPLQPTCLHARPLIPCQAPYVWKKKITSISAHRGF